MFTSTAGLLSAIIGGSSHRSPKKGLSLWKNGDIIAHFPGMSIQIDDEYHERERIERDLRCRLFGPCHNTPYELGLASYGMGASIAVAARSTHVALTGDYALLHSGLNALIDVYEKEPPLLTIIMKNNCTAMTGKQKVC